MIPGMLESMVPLARFAGVCLRPMALTLDCRFSSNVKATKCFSPEGTAANSQGREPLVPGGGATEAPQGRQSCRAAPPGLLGRQWPLFQGLAPLAIVCRRFAAKSVTPKHLPPTVHTTGFRPKLRLPFIAPSARCSSPAGFTLLEVLLAVALSAVVLGLVATAIDLHLRLLDYNRTNIEQSQLARTILTHIADDLHSAIPYPTSGTTTSDSGGTSVGGSGSTTVSTSASTSTAATANTMGGPSSSPGLYGDNQQMYFDFSRLNKSTLILAGTAAQATSGTVNPVGDVKTVLYAVGGNNNGNGSSSMVQLDASQQGLIRFEMDRAEAVQANANGQFSADQVPEPGSVMLLLSSIPIAFSPVGVG